MLDYSSTSKSYKVTDYPILNIKPKYTVGSDGVTMTFDLDAKGYSELQTNNMFMVVTVGGNAEDQEGTELFISGYSDMQGNAVTSLAQNTSYKAGESSNPANLFEAPSTYAFTLVMGTITSSSLLTPCKLIIPSSYIGNLASKPMINLLVVASAKGLAPDVQTIQG